ncbi:MAG: ester cyclase [Candidatus Hinthialibacter sp.]
MPELVPSFTLPDPEPTGLSPLEANAEIIARMNNFDTVGLAKMLHQDAALNSTDRNGYIAQFEIFFNGFSDIQTEIVRVIDLGDGWILTEIINYGTNDGNFFGMPPTGKTMDIRGAILYHFDENGLLTEGTGYYDQVTLLAQLGVIPRMVPSPASEAEMRATMDQMYQAFNTQDLATGVNLWTDDFVYDFVAEPPARQGKEAGMEFLEIVFEGFPDFHSDAIHDPVSIKDQIMVRDSLLTATHLGEILSIPATGNQCISRYLIIFQYSGTAISRMTEYFDMSNLLIQFGLLPPLQMPPLDPSFTLPDPEPTELSPLESAQEFFEYWKNQEMPQLAARMNPEGEFMTALGAPLDRGQVIGVLEHIINCSPDMQNNAVRFIDLSDGWVAVEGTLQGTQTGPYFGIPGTGNPYDFRWAGLYHFDEDGLLTNFELFYDNVTLLTQIGVLPPLE